MTVHRKMPEIPIPRPPRKVAEVKLPPQKRFFKNLLPRTIVRREETSEGTSRLPKGIWWGVLGILILFIAGFAISFFLIKRSISHEISSRALLFRAGLADLQNG